MSSKNINANNLGEEIRRIRKNLNMTLDKLSALSGIDRSTISAYENQKYIPNMRTAAMLLDALGYEMTIKKKNALLNDEEEEIEGPELGNILFGNSRGEYRVERKPIQEMWYAAFEGLLDDYGYLENKSLKAYETSRGGVENEICLINPYYWGDDDDIAQEHNFIYKPENICIDWYKYPMRDAYCNIELSPEKAEEIFKRCAENMRSMNDETI